MSSDKLLKDSTLRFSSRVDNYARYRPGYPQEILALLERECGFTPDSVVADVGSGTGLLSELFLKNGNPVFAVEPNREMRETGERLLTLYPEFRSFDGRAESLPLEDASVDLVVAGQAFHWFDRESCRTEFARVLRPQGYVVIIWNRRRRTETPFMEAYESLMQRYATDYEAIKAAVGEPGIRSFFAPVPWRSKKFASRQTHDLPALRGLAGSASYMPEAGDANYEPMLAEISRIFEAHQVGGVVTLDYETEVYYGRLHV